MIGHSSNQYTAKGVLSQEGCTAIRGSIRVESGPGAGATFTIELPCVAPTGGSAQTREETSPMSQISSGCVLVVDDEPDVCETVRIILQLDGYQVVTAYDGAHALEKLRGGVYPCLILLDLMMPVMNGMQFREEQMHDPKLKEIPVYAVTGGGKALEKKAAALGMEALRKPIDLDALLALVARYCRPAEPSS